MSVIIKFTNQITDNELLLIEIQGSIQHTIESKFNYMYLGKINKINDDSYILNIGNHQIVGKRTKLKNCMMVCEKIKEQGQMKLKVLRIVKEKILFNSRPTPVLTNF